jgi:hypothetical protein
LTGDLNSDATFANCSTVSVRGKLSPASKYHK